MKMHHNILLGEGGTFTRCVQEFSEKGAYFIPLFMVMGSFGFLLIIIFNLSIYQREQQAGQKGIKMQNQLTSIVSMDLMGK